MRLGFAIILIILWLLGIFGSYAVGSTIDLLLVIAALLLVIELRGLNYHRDSASDHGVNPDGAADGHGRGPAVAAEPAQVHHLVSGRPQEIVPARRGAVTSGDDLTVVLHGRGETAPVSDKCAEVDWHTLGDKRVSHAKRCD